MNFAEDRMTDIRYTWVPVGVARGVPFRLSTETPAGSGPLIRRPAIYRWVFFKQGVDCPVGAYVGEAKNLAKRIREYTRPSPKGTCREIKNEIERAIGSGLNVQLAILKIEPARLNRVDIREETLSDTFVRRMVENFILADFDVVNCKLLNIDLNIFDARRRKAAKNNPYAQILSGLGLDADKIR